MTNTVSRFWDVGEYDTRPPTFTDKSLARVMRALVFCRGRLHDSCIMGNSGDPDRLKQVLYRISLPIGAEDTFQLISGYNLTNPPDIRGQ